MPTRSYLSQVELAVTFGLGKNSHVDHLSIDWPNGTHQDVAMEAVDREMVITQSTKKNFP